MSVSTILLASTILALLTSALSTEIPSSQGVLEGPLISSHFLKEYGNMKYVTPTQALLIHLCNRLGTTVLPFQIANEWIESMELPNNNLEPRDEPLTILIPLRLPNESEDLNTYCKEVHWVIGKVLHRPSKFTEGDSMLILVVGFLPMKGDSEEFADGSLIYLYPAPHFIFHPKDPLRFTRAAKISDEAEASRKVKSRGKSTSTADVFYYECYLQTKPVPTISLLPLTEYELNTSITLSIEMSGLVSSPFQFHIRSECHRLWSFLDDGVDEVKFVKGPPGVGKSIEVYQYAMYHCQKMEKRVLYVHCSLVGYSIVFQHNVHSIRKTIRCRKFNRDMNNENLEVDSLTNWIHWTIKCKRVDCLVIDGDFKNDLYLGACKEKYKKSIESLIICTSFQSVWIKGSYIIPNSTFQMCSWTWDEYINAIDSDALRVGVDFKEKYFYSGGNIRMMSYDVEEIKKYLDNHIIKVKDFSALLSGHIGYASESASNSLMAIYKLDSEPISILISEYVAKKLSGLCLADTVLKCRKIWVENPSWQDWITEMEVLSLIENTETLTVWDENDKKESWSRGPTDQIRSIVRFWSVSELNNRTLKSGQYLFPTKWNQDCFDALYLMEEKKLRVLQITQSETHSCKLDLLIPFVETLKIESIEYVIVCRRLNFDAFNLPNATQYPELKKKIGKKKGRIVLRKVCYEQP